MADEGFKRKLTAILSADVEGYSRLMGDDEESTVRTLTAYREVMTTLIKQHNGKVLDSTGDNLLAEFVSVVDAVQCAVAVQKEIKVRNDQLPENRRMQFRIGINLGDVIQEEDLIYGDGVNIAARLEGLAEPGGICISKTAFDHIESKLPYGYEFLGDQTVKNIAKPVGAYRVLMEPRVTVAGEPEKEKRPPMKRMPILVGITALVVLAVAVGIWQFYIRRPSIEPASEKKMAFPLPEKPSIAVVPFDNLSGDPDQEYIADGICENIISTLSKIPALFVIARNSTFTYKGKPVKISQVSEELGVRYVLEGSVQKSGDRLRISAQLIDALKGNHLWAETYDRDMKNLFITMDDITLAIGKSLAVELLPYGAETGGRGIDTKDLKAWSLYVQGFHYLERLSKEDILKARELFEQAVDIDPNFTNAWTQLAAAHQFDARWFSSSPKESLELAKKIAIKSLEMNDSLSVTYVLLGDIYMMEKQYEEAISDYRKAVALDPNDPVAYFSLARGLFFYGQPDKAVPLIKKGMRLHPHYQWYFPMMLGKVYYHSGRNEDALAMFEQVYEMCKQGGCNPKWGHLYLSMVLIELGRDEEARAHMQKVLEHDPRFNIEDRRKQNLYKDQAMNERELAAHRKAGAPEHPASK
jgi:TolB-like protein/class 3 adenylate cyclase/Tfp pilus assembly protein PilF